MGNVVNSSAIDLIGRYCTVITHYNITLDVIEK